MSVLARPLGRPCRALAALLSVVLLVTACSDAPTMPALAPAQPNTSVAATGGGDVLFEVPVPATNQYAYGALGWTDVGITFPNDSWYEIEAYGTVHIGYNSAYTPFCTPNCAGSTPYAGQDATVWGVDNQLVLSWRLLDASGNVIDVRRVAKFDNPNRMYVVGRFPAGGKLQVARSGIAGGGGNTNGATAGAYTLESHEKILAKQIPAPLPAVTGSPSLPGSVTATVAWPYTPSVGMWWYFAPGDTAATPARPNGLSPVCSGSSSCTTTISGPGRFYVWFQHDNVNSAIAASDVVRGGAQPTVNVQCSPGSVVRGGTVSCTVGVTPSVAFRVLEVGSMGGGESGMPHVYTVDVAKGPGEFYTSTGVAALTSNVTARVEIVANGKPSMIQGTGSFIVTPRTWPLFQMASTPTLGHDPAYVTTTITSSAVAWGRHRPALPGPGGLVTADSLWGSIGVDTVQSGPNRGYAFSRQPIQPGASHVDVTPEVYQPYGQWASLQTGGTGQYGATMCAQSNIDIMRASVERHEGLTVAANSHEGLWRAKLDSAHLEVGFEAIVGYDLSRADLVARSQVVYSPLQNAMAAANDQFDSDEYGFGGYKYPSFAGGCSFRF